MSTPPTPDTEPSQKLIPASVRSFAAEPSLGVLSIRRDGSPHATPVGFTLDDRADIVRVITWEDSIKTGLCDGGNHVSVTWVSGPRWATIEGKARVARDQETIDKGVRAYAVKYRPPKVRSDRVVIEIVVEHVMASRSLLGPR